MNKIPFKMIYQKTDSGSEITLDQLLKQYGMLFSTLEDMPSLSQVKDIASALKKAGTGKITIPQNNTYHKLVVEGYKDKWNNNQVRFIYEDYRSPNAGETRPYTNEPWQAGDIINNIDVANADDKSAYWLCIQSGTDTLSSIWQKAKTVDTSTDIIDTVENNQSQLLTLTINKTQFQNYTFSKLKVNDVLNDTMLVEIAKTGIKEDAYFTLDYDSTKLTCPIYVETQANAIYVIINKKDYSILPDSITLYLYFPKYAVM